MKKIRNVLLIGAVAIFAAVFVPTEKLDNWKDSLFGIEDRFSSLRVYSLGGKLDISIDDEAKGSVDEEESYLEVFPVNPGEHKVELVRESSNEGFYEKFSRYINFEQGVDTIIGWEVGPTSDSSSGWVLSAVRGKNEANETKLFVSCQPVDCNIQIDGGEMLEAPVDAYELLLDSQHNVIASEDGYQDIEFPLLSDDESARKRLENYTLFLEINLYQIPLESTIE